MFLAPFDIREGNFRCALIHSGLAFHHPVHFIDIFHRLNGPISVVRRLFFQPNLIWLVIIYWFDLPENRLFLAMPCRLEGWIVQPFMGPFHALMAVNLPLCLLVMSVSLLSDSHLALTASSVVLSDQLQGIFRISMGACIKRRSFHAFQCLFFKSSQRELDRTQTGFLRDSSLHSVESDVSFVTDSTRFE